MSDVLTIARMMEMMPAAFQADKAAGLDVVIQFVFTGAESGEWFATLRNGTCQVEKGTAPNSRLTLTAQSQDYLSIVTGKLNPMTALAEGKIQLKGDMGLALKMMSFFKIPD
jgi:putative sterol carrier protein